MIKYILKRLFISIFVLLGVSIIIYTLVRMMPNDYLDIKFSSQLQQGTITPEQLMDFKNQYGIGDSSFKGLVNGYFQWLGNMLQGDLGLSFKYEKPVAQVIGENMCNPILQAKILNEAKTELNIVVGLCVGHDSLFYKYSDALVTTAVTKDRVTGHNPVAAIYGADFYFKKRFFPEK